MLKEPAHIWERMLPYMGAYAPIGAKCDDRATLPAAVGLVRGALRSERGARTPRPIVGRPLLLPAVRRTVPLVRLGSLASSARSSLGGASGRCQGH